MPQLNDRSPSAMASNAPMNGAKANTDPVRAAPKARCASRYRRKLKPYPVAPIPHPQTCKRTRAPNQTREHDEFVILASPALSEPGLQIDALLLALQEQESPCQRGARTLR